MSSSVIYKYPLIMTDKNVLSVPETHRILCIQIQGNDPCLWIQVDPKSPKKDINIRIYGTGHTINSDLPMEYIGTYQVANGQFIFHAFKEG